MNYFRYTNMRPKLKYFPFYHITTNTGSIECFINDKKKYRFNELFNLARSILILVWFIAAMDGNRCYKYS